jgi:ribosomal protein S12 methylthiotransferase
VDRLPGIDAVVGLGERDAIAPLVTRVATGKKARGRKAILAEGEFRRQVTNDQVRLRLTERCWAYLRISEGCSRGCTFCTIPAIRGPYRSKSPEAILAEARELIADGAVEINLIGQETTGYGVDLGYTGGLAALLRELNALPGLHWLRVMYAHPATMQEDQITALAECDKVVPYVDMPLQHINDRILRLMHRRITRQKTEDLLAKLRRRIDNVTIRTTMLVGFPSETPAEFEELLEFVRRQRFEALGCFAYSAEEGTAAARLQKQVPDEVKQERFERLMEVQQEIAFAHADGWIGRKVDCLVTRPTEAAEVKALNLEKGRKWFVARHAGQAAEIDSECFLAAAVRAKVCCGEIMKAKITGRRDYDLVGTIAAK